MNIVNQSVLVAVAGSRAYGMAREGSDVDLRGCYLPQRHQFFGFIAPPEQLDNAEDLQGFVPLLTEVEQATGDVEGSIYEIRKFVRLASECNPNLMDVLFCRDEEVRVITPLGEALRSNRRQFLSQQARFRYTGYASAQFKRIERHRKWLLNPPQRRPEREDFNLPKMPQLPKNQLTTVMAAITKRVDSWELDLSQLEPGQRVEIVNRVTTVLAEQGLNSEEQRFATAARHIGLDDNFIEVMAAERRYNSAKNQFKSYQHWKAHRNQERASLEEQFGYDTKHGAHLIRLLRMGVEILKTGEVQVWRGDLDAKELLSIRRGAWSWETFEEQRRHLINTLRTLPSSLPVAVDRALINQWLSEEIQRELARKPS